MKAHLLALPLVVVTVGCTTLTDPAVANIPAAEAEGAEIGFGQTVALGDLLLTPLRITEDSRCPINARCVWAGRITVETQIDGDGWQETVGISNDDFTRLHGHTVKIIGAQPGNIAGGEAIALGDYRFSYGE